MIYTLTVVCNMSIGIAAVIAALKFNVILPVFRPFIFCIWLGLCNEILSPVMVAVTHSNAVNSNIYVLLEALLIVWQFRQWGLFARIKSLFPLLMALLLLVWITENFIFVQHRAIQFLIQDLLFVYDCVAEYQPAQPPDHA